VTAVRTSYPGAEIAAVEHYSDKAATVLVTWKGPPANLKLGDEVAPTIQGLQVPFEALPVGTIRSAQEVSLAPGSVQQSIDKAGGERAIALRLVLSGAILVTTWYLCSRVKTGAKRP
jgi:predicted secreted protein